MAVGGKKQYDEEPWYYDVAEYMVRLDVNFSVACQALGIKMANSTEERKHERRKSFQQVYWNVYNSYHERIGANSTLNKLVAIGVGMKSLRRLSERDEDDKVATLLKTISEIAGWTKPEGTTSVVLGLSQSEIDAVKLKLRQLTNEPQVPESDKSDKPN